VRVLNADPFMLYLYAALAEKERRLISKRTKAALAIRKAGGKNLEIPRTSEKRARQADQRSCRRLTITLGAFCQSYRCSKPRARSPSARSCAQ
jgi:DNA invertase Pin-like site-specific DNA recombinase